MSDIKDTQQDPEPVRPVVTVRTGLVSSRSRPTVDTAAGSPRPRVRQGLVGAGPNEDGGSYR